MWLKNEKWKYFILLSYLLIIQGCLLCLDKNVNDFLKECLEALGDKATIIADKAEQELIISYICEMVPVGFWGRIDWHKVKVQTDLHPKGMPWLASTSDDIARLNDIYRKRLIKSEGQLIAALNNKGKENFNDIYVIWNDGYLPIIKCDLKTIVDNLFDVVTVSCDTWFFHLEDEWVIEFDHDGNVRLALGQEPEKRPLYKPYIKKKSKKNKLKRKLKNCKLISCCM